MHVDEPVDEVTLRTRGPTLRPGGGRTPALRHCVLARMSALLRRALVHRRLRRVPRRSPQDCRAPRERTRIDWRAVRGGRPPRPLTRPHRYSHPAPPRVHPPPPPQTAPTAP